MKKSIIMTISILCASSATWATIIGDDFDRAETAWSTDASLIGSHWKQFDGEDEWRIFDNAVQVYGVNGDPTLYNDELQTLSGGGNSFDLSMDVDAIGSVWAGIVFNYNNPSNYYMLRFKGDYQGYQVLGIRDNGSPNVIVNVDAPSTFALNTFYTLSVASDTAYEFDYSIKEAGSGTVVVSGSCIGDESLAVGGYAGALFSNSGPYAQYDNFSLKVIPEPATFGLLGLAGAAALFIRRRFV